MSSWPFLDSGGRIRLVAIFIAFIAGNSAFAQATKPRAEWLDRPWELRYVFYVTDSWKLAVEAATRRDEKASAKDLSRSWEYLFEPNSFHQSRDKWAKPGEGLTIVLIEFDRDGRVTTPHTFEQPLFGKLHRLLYVDLSPGDYATQPRFNLGKWFMGLGDISTHWAPGLCGHNNMPSPFSKTDDAYLYGPAFANDQHAITFGCREWAYQLYDPDRPYIDITSYVPKGPTFDKGTYIREVFGWARFADQRKPVIGKHEDDWYCLLDCPGGEAPGRIPNIRAWTAKNGWTVPKRPTRVPVFPDPPAKEGTYPK